MYSDKTTVINETGLHARPASDFVKKAAEFQSKVKLRRMDVPEELVNAKSIVMLLSLGVGKGVEVEITAEGEDEKEAVEALIGLINSGFGE